MSNYFEVGDLVECSQYGKGVVVKRAFTGCGIIVRFNDLGRDGCLYYPDDGKFMGDGSGEESPFDLVHSPSGVFIHTVDFVTGIAFGLIGGLGIGRMLWG